jgi:hypothetical protein
MLKTAKNKKTLNWKKFCKLFERQFIAGMFVREHYNIFEKTG